MGILLCAAAVVATYFFGRVSLPAGVLSVVAWGYVYGILRANGDGFTYFLFDCAVVGLYAARLMYPPNSAKSPSIMTPRRWYYILFGWAVLMFIVPLQPILIQVVGLRGNVFLLPFLLLGLWLKPDDARKIAYGLAVFNCVALTFAIAEYFLGVPRFFPENPVTKIIYNSRDVAGNTQFRIPATFANAHAYGGTMIYTLPWLVGAFVQPRQSVFQRGLILAGAAAAIIGVFLCAARTHVVIFAFLALVVTLSGKLKGGFWFIWIFTLLGVGYIVSNQERMQRFTTLQDTDAVVERIEGSVNVGLFDLVLKYPIGNGMGAGGTSIPHFLQHLVHDPVGLESEVSRILLEQGLVGLGLWVGFVLWFLTQRPSNAKDPWLLGKQVLWWLGVIGFVSALIGTGLMTSIPQTPLFFLGIGFALTPVFVRKSRPAPAPMLLSANRQGIA